MKFGYLTFFCLCHALSWAQKLPERILFEQVPVTGTIQSSITEDIIQDPNGMIWVGKNMLYRFNGRNFTKYSVILPDSTGFGLREITKLHWDTRGDRLLIGTRYQGLLQYTYRTDRVEKIASTQPSPIINEIVQTPDGEIWVGSFSGGLFQLRNDTLVKQRALGELQPNGIIVVNNELWVGSLNEILIVKNRQIKKRISLRQFAEYLPNALRPHSMLIDRRGHLWIGTERDGIIVLDTANYSLVKKFSPKQKPFYSSITRIAEDAHGLIWILTKGDGVILYSPEEDSFMHTTHQEADASSLSGDHCTSLCLDRSGIVWVGAAGALNKFDRTKRKFQHINYAPNSPISLSDDNIRGIYQSPNGKIYLATSGGYLNVVDMHAQRTEKIKVSVPGDTSFISPLSILPLDDQKFLVGTSAGLLEFHLPTNKFDYFRPLKNITKGLSVRQVISHNQFLYLITRGAVIKYNLSNGAISEFRKAQHIWNASHISIDSTGRLWVGIGKGLVYTDPTQQVFTELPMVSKKFRPDSSYFLTLSIKQVKDKVWVSMFNQGIYIFDIAQEKPVLVDHLNTSNGLPDNTVYATLPDRQNSIWMSHNGGLSQFFPEERRFTHFSVSEGLQDEEFNRLAYFQNERGEIILGGINGINFFDPSKIISTKVNLDIRIQSLRVLSLESSEPKVISLIGADETPELSIGENSLLFEFFVPDFQEPVRYSTFYKLEPFDKGWIETKDFFSPAYVNLPAGEYVFNAKAVGPSGEEKITQTSFIILPPFWQTWWFSLLVLFLVAGLIYGIVIIRVRSTEAARKRLEMLLKIRTREIVRSREELENLNKKKDLIFSILSHDLRSPLTTLKGFLGLLIENSEALSRDDLKKYALNIRNSVTNSLDLIDNTLYWSLSQTGNIQCTPTPVLLGPMFDKIKGLYQLTAEKKQIHLHFLNSNGLMVHADENMLYVLIRNLISNALKFTPEGKSIFIEAMQQGSWVSIRVKDQGVGMSPQEIDNIFELDNPAVKRGTSSEKGTGLGLLLCKKFVELNQGKLLIESEEGVGSQFTVLLSKA